MSFPRGSVVKNLPAIQETHVHSWLGRSAGERNGNTLQNSCLGNPTDREAWQATVHEVAKEWDRTYPLNVKNPNHAL